MSESVLHFFKRSSSTAKIEPFSEVTGTGKPAESVSGTCTEAETFALRVTDDSMEPEFVSGCLIVIDPTVAPVNGCFVLAKLANNLDLGAAEIAISADQDNNAQGVVDEMVFRQLKRVEHGWVLVALNPRSEVDHHEIEITLNMVEGVIVQRAGIRRAYHKHYTYKSDQPNR